MAGHGVGRAGQLGERRVHLAQVGEVVLDAVEQERVEQLAEEIERRGERLLILGVLPAGLWRRQALRRAQADHQHAAGAEAQGRRDRRVLAQAAVRVHAASDPDGGKDDGDGGGRERVLRREADHGPVHRPIARAEQRGVLLRLHEDDGVARLDVGRGDGHAQHPAVGDALVQVAPGDHRPDEVGQRRRIQQAVRAVRPPRAEDPARERRQVAPAEPEDLLEAEVPPALRQLAHGEIAHVVMRGDRAGVDRAHAGARKDPRPGVLAQPRGQLPEDVAEHADFVRAARAPSGEHEREW